MRIVVNAIAASEGGALSILKSLYEYAVEQKDSSEWFFLLSNNYIEEKDNIHIVLCEKEKKRAWRLLFDNFYGGSIINNLKPDVVLYLQNTLIRGVKAKQIMYMDQPLPFQDTYRFSFLKKEERPYAIYQYIIGILIKDACKKSDKIIVQTEWIRDAIIEKCNVSEEKLAIIPPEIVRESVPSGEYDLDTKKFFYPSSGAFYKNHVCISRAMSLLEEEGIEDIDVGVTIERDQKLNKNIHFYGRVQHKDVMQCLATSTLIFPSFIETYGLPLVEARMAGTVILASDTSFSHELLDDYENAYFFDPFSPKELAELMKKVYYGQIIRREVSSARDKNTEHVNTWSKLISFITENNASKKLVI